MSFVRSDLGTVKAGSVVEVTMTGVESDVMVMTPANVDKYKRGQSSTYYGGHYKRSPVRIPVPSSGSWCVLVVPKGGRVRASVKVRG
jgi:hypothetical protein